MQTEGKASDPIKYCKDMVKKIRRTYHILGPLEMRISEELWEAVCEHSVVRRKIAVNKYPQAASDAIIAQLAGELEDEDQ